MTPDRLVSGLDDGLEPPARCRSALADGWRQAWPLMAGYLLLAAVSLYLSRQPGSIATIWYANALAIGVLMRIPVDRCAWLPWVAVALACLIVNLLWEPKVLLALSFVAPNLLEIGLAVTLLRRAGLHRVSLQSPWALLRLLGLGGVLPQMAGASLGALLLWGQLGMDPETAWLRWFQGSVIGALSVLALISIALRQPQASLKAALEDWRFLAALPITVAITLAAMAFTPFAFILTALPLLLSAMVLGLLAVCVLTLGVSLTVAVALASGLFVPPPAQSVWAQGYVYLAFAAALLPAQMLAATVAAVRLGWERLEQRTRELEAANERLEQFVRMASHDLREPLNTVTQFSGLLRADLGDRLDARSAEYLRLMDKAARRMRQLLDDVLQYARLRRGQEEPVQAVDLAVLVADVQEALAASLGRRDALLEVEPLPVVQGHPALLSLLFQNLLSNSLKFVPADRRPRVRVSARVVDTAWVIGIQDNGVGIAAEDIPRLFKPFARLHPQRKFEGTGLGLSLSLQAAQAHGGRIEIESVLGQGSCFRVWLPAMGGDAMTVGVAVSIPTALS
ncbi:MAG: sensor histidine kinase [Rubrivivax sp.]